MDIKKYVKQFAGTYDHVHTAYNTDFKAVREDDKEWLDNLEDKTHLFSVEADKDLIDQVILKLKQGDSFLEDDTANLSAFVGKINTIVKVANRINNFKEGTKLDDGRVLNLHQLFNAIRSSESLGSLDYPLNVNLKGFLPHLYSIVKHCQNPQDYPIYYKYWKNIMKEVLSKDADYDSMCSFYRTFPSESRHLSFASYFGAIGIQIATNIGSSGIVLTKDSKGYKYLVKDIINIEQYYNLMDPYLDGSDTEQSMKRYWLCAPGENARKWDDFYEEGVIGLGWDKIGDLKQYSNKEALKQALDQAYGGSGSKKNNVLANDEFLNGIAIGDMIIAKKGRGELLGYGVVTSDYKYDANRSEYNKFRNVDWKLKGNWQVDFKLVLKTLTDITKYPSDHPDYDTFYEKLLGIMGVNNKSNNAVGVNYALNTILYGPPGTGKTYNTILRAAEIVENRRIQNYGEAMKIFKANLHDRIEFITFHQNYSYEDFIQGLRPDTESGDQLTFERKEGVFKQIADKALKNIRLTNKPPEELSREAQFNEALEKFKDIVLEEDRYPINDTAYIIGIDEDAFRYTGDEWKNNARGLRMKFADLVEFYKNDVKSRKDVKKLTSVSGLANQHATYYFLVYSQILEFLPKTAVSSQSVEKLNYVIIIDEINRANISRVFGELITLIEPDKRSDGEIPLEARLPSGDKFMVPSNLYIIGTMNTADKSIALLDIALRRRFEFVSMYPQYEIPGKILYDVDVLQKINERIIKSKGHDFQIGHAYFMGESNQDLVDRMNKKVIPLLLEYYMNDKTEVEGILKSAGLAIEEKSWPLRITGRDD